MTRGEYEEWLVYYRLALTGAAGSSGIDTPHIIQNARRIATKAVKEQNKIFNLVKIESPRPRPGQGVQRTP